MKHTPKPWTKEVSKTGGFDILGDNGKWIATVHGGVDEDEPNADLITAAPELLEALEQIIAGWDAPTYGDHEALIDHLFPAIELARTVIAKAGGGKPCE